MNELQINYFLSVSETQNINESARQLYVSAPAVSKQILSLEAELGFPLFSRTSRGVKLLPEGRRLKELLLSSREQLDQLKRNAVSGKEHRYPPFRFALPIDWMPNRLLCTLRRTLGEDLRIIGMEITQMLSRLDEGELDMCLLSVAALSPAGSGRRQQYLQPLKRVVLYGPENPAAEAAAAEGRTPTLSELARTPLVITNSEVEAGSSAFCISHGINPSFMEAGTMHSVLQTVGAGIGFCLTDEWCIAANHAGFGRLDMPDTAHACLFWNPKNTHLLNDIVVESLMSGL